MTLPGVIVDIDSRRWLSWLIDVHFDGLCQPVNPGGIACYAFIVERDGKLEHSEYGMATEPYSPDSTNNIAEYTALVKALQWLTAHSLENESIRIASDSRLVVSQIKGEFKIRSERIAPLYRKASDLKSRFRDLEIRWVPREENKEADALTNRAYAEALRSAGAKKLHRPATGISRQLTDF